MGNFGIEKYDIEIYIGNYSCESPSREEDPETQDPKFKCTLRNVNAVVGFTSAFIRVSKQKISIPTEDKMMSFICPFNTYGRIGERCSVCPVGAYCAVGYEDDVPFCAKCDENNYRVDLSCHPCTNMATLKLLAFIGSVLLLVLIVLNLSAFELKLATINIMIDLVQVIALCGAYFLDWTTSATMIIEGSRVVLFNVENTEPECLNSEWTYETGYWVLETLPITFLVSLWFMSHIYHFLRA